MEDDVGYCGVGRGVDNITTGIVDGYRTHVNINETVSLDYVHYLERSFLKEFNDSSDIDSPQFLPIRHDDSLVHKVLKPEQDIRDQILLLNTMYIRDNDDIQLPFFFHSTKYSYDNPIWIPKSSLLSDNIHINSEPFENQLELVHLENNISHISSLPELHPIQLQPRLPIETNIYLNESNQSSEHINKDHIIPVTPNCSISSEPNLLAQINNKDSNFNDNYINGNNNNPCVDVSDNSRNNIEESFNNSSSSTQSDNDFTFINLLPDLHVNQSHYYLNNNFFPYVYSHSNTDVNPNVISILNPDNNSTVKNNNISDIEINETTSLIF